MKNIKSLDIYDIEKEMYREEYINVAEYDELEIRFKTLSKEKKIPIAKPYELEEMYTKLTSNNLTIQNEMEELKCKELLRSVSYYNIKHFISNEFGKHEMKKFKDLEILYDFDRFLVGWLFSILNKLEIHLRTTMVEVFLNEIEIDSEDKALFYLDETIYFKEENGMLNKTNQKIIEYNKLQNSFYKAVIKNRTKNNIKYNLDKYGVVPAWVLFDYLTLGELSNFYYRILSSHKNKFATKLERHIFENTGEDVKLPSKILGPWLNSIRYLRNKVSHTEIIYGKNFDITSAKHDSDKYYYEILEENKYENRLVVFLLAMKMLYKSMTNKDIVYWNNRMDELKAESEQSEVIKLTRLGILKDDIEYLKIACKPLT